MKRSNLTSNYIVSTVANIAIGGCQWCIILCADSKEAHWRFKHVQLTYNRCYSLVADLRGPVAGWPAAPHPTIPGKLFFLITSYLVTKLTKAKSYSHSPQHTQLTHPYSHNHFIHHLTCNFRQARQSIATDRYGYGSSYKASAHQTQTQLFEKEICFANGSTEDSRSSLFIHYYDYEQNGPQSKTSSQSLSPNTPLITKLYR